MRSKINSAVLLTVIFVVLFSSQAFSKNKAAEKERMKISKGKVSIMNEYLFFPKTNTQKKKSFQTFNADGNRVSVVELDNEEKEIKITEYTYDAKHNEIGFVEYDGTRNVRQKCVNKYDAGSEILTEELFYNAAGHLAYRRIAKTDKNQNISEQLLYDKNNKFLGKSTYKYDASGNRIESLSYDASNNLSARYVYNYDKNGNLIEFISYDKNNKFSGKKVNNYDQKGLLAESIGYNAAGMANSWRKYEYIFSQNQVSSATKPPAQTVKNTEPPKPEKVNIATEEVKVSEIASAPANNTPTLPAAEANHESLEAHSSPEPNFMDTLSESEKKDINFYYTIQDIKNQSAENIKKVFEDKKMDVNTQNSAGITFLMLAVDSGDQKLVKYLLENGASLELKDKQENDIQYYLKYAQKKNRAVEELIKNAGK